MLIAFLVSLLYLLVPGHPDLPGSGLPLRVPEIVLIAVVVTLWLWSRPAASTTGPPWTPTLVIVVAALLKMVLAFAWSPTGWVAEYYANDSLQPPMERSTEFLPGALAGRAAATRIDPRLDFRDTRFPVHFFNEYRFAHGFRREVTDPFSVRWSGQFHAFDNLELTLVLDARGDADVFVDGRQAMGLDSPSVDGTARGEIRVAAGDHAIEVRYRKPANTDPLLRLSRSDAGIVSVFHDPAVLPFAPADWRRAVAGLLPAAGWMGHGAALLALLAWLGPPLRKKTAGVFELARRDRLAALDQIMMPALSLALIVQGAIKARPLIDRVWTLTAGDDWFEFEAQARDIVVHGLMMTQGAIVGRGQPYFYYPGYGYFLAAAHRLTGESLAGVILVHFLLLAAASALVYLLARALDGSVTAIVSSLWLLALEQADFVRYYSVTLLSENLFYLTSAATVYGLTQYVRRGASRHLVLAALAGGLSALTRPTIMLFLPLAATLVGGLSWRRVGAAAAPVAPCVFVALWMLAIAPATIRNYYMSGTPALISSGQAATFVNDNLPAENAQAYRDAFEGTLFSALKVLARIMIEHPRDFARNMYIKLGFSLGMVQWMGSSLRPHPELVITSLAYLLAFLLVPQARQLEALPLHFFVATHLATLMLTMPSNYGYRLLLPMYLFMPVFGAAAALRVLRRSVVRRSGDAGQSAARAAAG